MTSTGSTDVHCFARIRERNCIGKEGDEELPKIPLRFKQDENGLDERLAIPGINWNGFVRLRNRIFLSFTESLDDAIQKKASIRNLSVRYACSSVVRCSLATVSAEVFEDCLCTKVRVVLYVAIP